MRPILFHTGKANLKFISAFLEMSAGETPIQQIKADESLNFDTSLQIFSIKKGISHHLKNIN